ncbi:MAG: hypothetical protein WKF40_06845 [Thermoleophilaceae bacterium]
MTLVDPELARRVIARALTHGGDVAETLRRGPQRVLPEPGRRPHRTAPGRDRAGRFGAGGAGDSTFFGHVDGLSEEALIAVAGSVAQAVRGEAREPAALGAPRGAAASRGHPASGRGRARAPGRDPAWL